MARQFRDYKDYVVVDTVEGCLTLLKDELTGRTITTDKGFGIKHEGVYVGVVREEFGGHFTIIRTLGGQRLFPHMNSLQAPRSRVKQAIVDFHNMKFFYVQYTNFSAPNHICFSTTTVSTMLPSPVMDVVRASNCRV